MFSINALSWTFAKPLAINPRKISFAKFFVSTCSSLSSGNPYANCCQEQFYSRTSGFSGTNIEETVNLDSGKLRLDTWISSRINGISGARVQSSIRSGLVIVNGQVISKVSHVVGDGVKVNCTIAELQPLRAEPEEIPLDVVYEDEHVLVVNKPAHMVVHPAPGNASGTLVNGVLHHCRLSTVSNLNTEALSDADDVATDDTYDFFISQAYDRSIEYGYSEASVRHGIVHRLDKGTSGLLVVAKDELSHAHLAEQFKKHTIKRVYVSLTCGVPSPLSGHVDIPIGRDVNNRILMAAVPGSNARGKPRNALSSGNITPNINKKASYHSNALVSKSDSCYFQEPFSDMPKNFDLEDKTSMKFQGKKLPLDCSISPTINGITWDIVQSSNQLSISHLLNRNTSRSVYQVRQIHAQLLKTDLFNLSHYITKLVSLYANQLYFSDAQSLLHSVFKPDIFSFTTLIFSASKFNDFKNTLGLFTQMLAKGIFPDGYVLPSVIKACAGLLVTKIGKQIHGYSLSSGLFLDPFVGSSLLHFYLKCGDLAAAHKLFDSMVERDVQSWSALAAGYARKGDVFNAKNVFNEVQNLGFAPNSVSWNGMIAGFNQSGCVLEAVLMFQQMHLLGFETDGTSISSVLPAIGDLGNLYTGTQIHGHVLKIGFTADKCVVSALTDMYSKCGCYLEMSQVFQEMGQGDVGTCNALVAGLSRLGHVDEALKVFKEFQNQKIELNVVSWTSMIACCSQHGKDIEALDLFREMQVAGVKPNSVTIPCLLPACGNIAALSYGKAAHSFSLKSGIASNVYIGSALIDMYANCGKIHLARCCFDRMPVCNLVCWNAVIGAYSMHGKAKETIEIFLRMLKTGQKPDSISFTSLLSACSQSGLTEEGRYYFESMSKDHGIEARLEHYACIVSLLGRAGKLEEAYSLMMKMPFEPDACVWGALLSSCRLHHNMNLGEIAAYKLFKLEPRNPGNYVLLSNIYASKGKWKDVDKIRDIMKDKGLKKNPGCSWIEVKNKVHMILAGDKSLPQMLLIMEKLNQFSMEMKKSGFLPSTDYVLQDVEEQEKEHILCGHSEKLAVVFGILNSSQGSPLRVTKNLRICGDCHNVIKFISKFERREIFVRDTNRYHHFKDGCCSCGDYW